MPACSDPPCFASVDIGSHTIRMLIARLNGSREIVPLRMERAITRLARNFQEGGTLKSAAMQESLHVLKTYKALLDDYRVRAVECGATGVVRRALNQETFVQAIEESTGLRVSILSETEEAVLSAKGILSALPSRHGIIVSFDLGGSSTEFLLMQAQAKASLWTTSVFIGAATLTEQYLRADPPEPSSVARAAQAAREHLAPALAMIHALFEEIGGQSAFQLVGTAGTVTTLAAMALKMTDYQPFRVNGLVLTDQWIDEITNLLAHAPLSQRRKIEGLEPGREDIILGGALIVREILQGLREPQLTVTDGGLLEGLLLDLLQKEYGWERTLSSPLTWRPNTGNTPLQSRFNPAS